MPDTTYNSYIRYNSINTVVTTNLCNLFIPDEMYGSQSINQLCLTSSMISVQRLQYLDKQHTFEIANFVHM